jgi:hypothetical protein
MDSRKTIECVVNSGTAGGPSGAPPTCGNASRHQAKKIGALKEPIPRLENRLRADLVLFGGTPYEIGVPPKNSTSIYREIGNPFSGDWYGTRLWVARMVLQVLLYSHNPSTMMIIGSVGIWLAGPQQSAVLSNSTLTIENELSSHFFL